MPTNHELLARITARPDVFGGKPIIRDMRISVEMILSLMTQGVSPEAILDDYPDSNRTIFGPVPPTPTRSSLEIRWPQFR